jgi:hypothetical protein
MEIETIINSAMVFAAGLFGGWLGSYLNKSGELKAEKEMIGSIETIKRQIELTNNLLTARVSDERLAIYNLIESYYSWLYNSQNLVHLDLSEKGLNDHVIKHAQCEKQYFVAVERILIFIDTEEMHIILSRLKELTRNLAGISLESFNEQLESDREMQRLSKTPDVNKTAERERHIQRGQNIVMKYGAKSQIVMKELNQIIHKFRAILKQNLDKPINQP